MTNKNNDLVALKKQMFHVADDLDMLRSSYDSLQVITAGCTVDASHVGHVLYGLNYRFEALMTDFDRLRKAEEGAYLRSVR